jgi:phosphatidylserine/phosphatidylglycerophosphate/cardiolipin synthase-like enzyme/N-acetyl-anhydromuramyl-L-alanine amidase AmpD
MESPFSNYTGQSAGVDEVNYAVDNDLEARGPFVASVKRHCNCGSVQHETEDAFMHTHEAVASADMLPVLNETNFFPGMEGELSGSEVNTAMTMNAALMNTLQWAGHVDAIVALLKNKTGLDAKASGSVKYDVFAKAVDKYQELKKLNPTNKGVIAIGTWSVIQDDLGFIQYTKPVRINLSKARDGNSKYQKELWSDQLPAILKHLAAKGIIKYALPLDSTYFALVIAKWQESKYTNANDIDGMLGPGSWKLMKADISSTPPPVVTPPVTRSRWHSIVPGAVLCDAEPLMDGAETFAKMVDAIRSVKQNGIIYIMGWMLDVHFELIPGQSNSTLFGLLNTAATSKNAEIRVLIWGNPDYRGELFQAQMLNGLPNTRFYTDNVTFGSPDVASALGKARAILSQVPTVAKLVLQQVSAWNDLVAYAALPNEGSHHEKVVIVDTDKGLTAFCGGIDINKNRFSKLHDMHCKFTGNAATQLLRRFIERWTNFINTKGLSSDPKVALNQSSQALSSTGAAGPNASYVSIKHTYNRANGTGKDRSIRDTLKAVIQNARKSIWMEDQYMVSCEIARWMNQKLKADPNFDVRILTQDDVYAKEDMKIPKRKRGEFIRVLMDGIPNPANVKIWETIPITPGMSHVQVHSKVYVIDGELAIIGSANCNRRSMFNDSETAAFVFNDGTGYSFAKHVFQKFGSYHTTNFTMVYKPNSNVDDLDVSIAKQLQAASGIISMLPAGLTINLLLGIVKQYVPAAVDWLWEVIDPNPDRIVCAVPPVPSYWDTLLGDNEVGETQYLEAETVSMQLPRPKPLPWEQPETSTVPLTGFEVSPGNGNYFRDKQIAEAIEQQVAPAKAATPEGRTCWAKIALNTQLGLSLPADNNLDETTKRAIAAFQLKQNLPQTQKIDPVTERALLEADALVRHKGTVQENAANTVITAAKTRIEDFTAKAVVDKNEITSTYRDPRKLWAFVLHQMAFKRRGRTSKQFSDPSSYLKTGAHFCIMLDGRIIQLHAFSRLIWHAQCISPRSVAVEFEGNFPNVSGRWWIDKDSQVQNRDQPTAAQFDSGRFLASYLKIVLGTTHILAHRQSSDSRENDPGPDIWYNVGQWSVDNLGLTDGGNFKCGTGNPLLQQWRTWGTRTTPPVTKEFSYETDLEYDEEEPAYEQDNALNEYQDHFISFENGPVEYTGKNMVDEMDELVYG